MDSPTPGEAILAKIVADPHRAALAKAIALLEQAEYSGSCNSEGDCHGCAWDSDRDILVDKWRHLLR